MKQIKASVDTLRIRDKRDKELLRALNNVRNNMIPNDQLSIMKRSLSNKTRSKLEVFMYDTLMGDIRTTEILLGNNARLDVEYEDRDLVGSIAKSRELLEVYYFNALSNQGLIQASELNGLLDKYMQKIAYNSKPANTPEM